MRLFELLQEDPFTVQDIERKNLVGFGPLGQTSRELDKKTQFLGAGYYSTVLSSDDNPHDVVKGSRGTTKQKDGYEAFIRALANDPEMRDNIHMPRIRSAKVMSSTDGKKSNLLVRLERLHEIRHLSEREAYDILVRLIGRENARKYWLHAMDMPGGSKMRTNWPWVLGEYLDAYSAEKETRTEYPILDAELLQAYKWASSIAKKEGWVMDLHSGNWMIRRTPYGPQLVISDPFAMRWSEM
jgi:hypothetical protein